VWASRCDKGLGILAELAVRQRHRRQGGPLLQPIATHSPRPTHQELRLVVAFLPLLHALCSRLGKRQGALDGAKVHGCRGGRGHQWGEGRAPGCSQKGQGQPKANGDPRPHHGLSPAAGQGTRGRAGGRWGQGVLPSQPQGPTPTAAFHLHLHLHLHHPVPAGSAPHSLRPLTSISRRSNRLKQ